MGFMGGGGGQAGGWSQNIAGQGGMIPARRNTDGWDEEYLGSVYDAEVVKRLMPYIKEYKLYAIISMITMVLSSVAQYTQPLLIGLIVKSGIKGNETDVFRYAGLMVGLAVIMWVCNVVQQLA